MIKLEDKGVTKEKYPFHRWPMK